MPGRRTKGRGWRAGALVSLVAVTGVPLAALVMDGCSWASEPSAAAPPPRQPAPGALTLDVREPLGMARRGWPVSAGVPFARGSLTADTPLRVRAGAAVLPVQTRVLSRWPDGSVRWLLLDWQTDLAAREQRRFEVERGALPPPAQGVHARETGTGVLVDTGPLQFRVPKDRFAVLADVRLDGKAVLTGPVDGFLTIDGKRVPAEPPQSVTVTEAGPLRARVEITGRYASGFDYVVRIDAFANQSFVRVYHTFEQRSPAVYTYVQQIALTLPLALRGPAGYVLGRDGGSPWTGALPPQGLSVWQEDNETLHVAGTRHPARAAGWLETYDDTHGMALAARFFWQEYPQGFNLGRDGLTYDLWASEAQPAKVGMGAAKTHEFTVYFHGPTPPSAAFLQALSEPLTVRLDPHQIAASGALRNAVAPTHTVLRFLRGLADGYRHYLVHADTERWDDSGQVTCPDPAHERPRRGFYGMFNWGDWNFPGYHDTTKGCDAWGNLEYDTTQVLALAYAATADPAYYTGMVAAARHFMDVDCIHYQSKRPAWVGMNHPKNPLHFAFELGGVDLGHTWTEGLLSYYYFTGDARALDAARGIANYLVRRLRSGILGGNPRQWGWPQIALVAVYEATGDRTYRDAAVQYAHGGMAAHPVTDLSAWKMGILAEALTYTHSVTGDAAMRDWLVRYAAQVAGHQKPLDPRFFPAVAYVGRLTGNDAYLLKALGAAEHLKFGGWGKSLTIAGRLSFSILSQAATPALPPPQH